MLRFNLKNKLVRMYLYDLESIVRKQDEIIWKLNDDNLLLKSRLLSLEKLITKMNENGPENNSLINN